MHIGAWEILYAFTKLEISCEEIELLVYDMATQFSLLDAATDYRINKAHKFTEHCMYRQCLWLYAYQPILGGVAYKEPKPHPK